MSWSWGDFCKCSSSGSDPTPAPDPVPVPVVEDSVAFSDAVAEALDRLPQQYKDSKP